MKYLVPFIIFSSLCYPQKTEYYRYGYEGIEMFAKFKDSTIIYTQHLAKATIRKDVALVVLNLYPKRKLNNGHLVVELPNAIVTGEIKIERAEKLVVINYYYEKVEWCDKNLIEIPEELKKSKIDVHTNKR
jgi:hypothetical protein